MDHDQIVGGERWFRWIGAAGIAVLLAGLALPLTDGDTAFYATVARGALKSGEWVALYTPGGQVFDKPPLTIWLLGLSMAAFGSAEWALRLWHIVLALATVFVTYRLARLTLSVRQSLAAALVLLTSGQFFYQSLVPQQDIPLTLFLAMAMYWYLRWEQAADTRAAVLTGISCALAVLSKGLIGMVLPVLIVVVHLALDRPTWPRSWPRHTAAAVLAFFIVAAPWFVVAGLRQGRAFVDTFFLSGALGIGRFFHPALSSPSATPAWTGMLAYLIFLPLGMLPWTGWLWPGLRDGWQARTGGPSVLRFCTVWLLTVLAFLTLSPGDKVIRYLLPAIPAVAVLIGHATDGDRWSKLASRVSIAIGGLLSAALVWLSRQSLPADAAAYLPLVLAFLLPLMAGLIGGALLLFRSQRSQALVFISTLTLIAYGMLTAATVRQWDRISPWRPISRVINQIDAPRVLIMGERSPFAEFYVEHPVEFVDREGLIERWRAESVVAVIPVDALASLAGGPVPVIVGQAPGRLLIIRNF